MMKEFGPHRLLMISDVLRALVIDASQSSTLVRPDMSRCTPQMVVT